MPLEKELKKCLEGVSLEKTICKAGCLAFCGAQVLRGIPMAPCLQGCWKNCDLVDVGCWVAYYALLN